jgi:CBS domain-containing protein
MVKAGYRSSEADLEGGDMAESIRDVMSQDPTTVDASATIQEVAQLMAKEAIGSVLIVENGEVQGIVTDRDIVVRVLAKGNGPDASAREACTTDLETLSPDDSLEDGIRKMKQANVRRLPVVEDGKPVGIVSLGDLAQAKDRDSALADISSEAPNN